MRLATFLALLLICLCRVSLAQHCAPIGESYLSELSVKHDDKVLKLRGEYRKRGGQAKDKYQLYVLAYLDADAGKVPAVAPAALFDPERVLVLQTQLIDRKDDAYPFEYQIELAELAQRFLKQDLVIKAELSKSDKPGTFRGTLRLAVFVPFLEDEKYATLEGLPADKHECNYSRAPALLFQQLPYNFRLNSFAGGNSFIDINSDQITPAKPK
jgi:hypothetical protein